MSQDTKTAFNYLIDKGIQPSNIYVAGHSFGAYTAALLAKNNKIGKLILISPIETMMTTLEHQFKSIKIPLSLKQILIKSNLVKKYLDKKFLNTTKLIKKCNIPIDIIHSEKDTLISKNGFDIIAKNCKKLNSITILPGGSHKLDSLKIDELAKILNEEV